MMLDTELHSERIRYGLILVFISVTTGRSLTAQPVYRFEYPFSTSPFAGAEFHSLLHHEISELDNRYVPSKIFFKEDALSKTGNVLYRLLRIGTYGFYLAYIPVINQHEYFGHLARAKQLKAGFTRYQIYFFPPSGGRAYFGNHEYYPLTSMERMLEVAGGMEANSIMAERIRTNALLKGTVSFHDAMFYLGASTDFSTYVLLTNNGSYDDITQYLYTLNTTLTEDEKVHRDNLRAPALLSVFLDPFAVLSFYNLAGRFVIAGKVYSKTPMLHAGNIEFLPVYAFELAADGPRNCLNGYLVSHDNLYKIGGYASAFGIKRSFGLEMAIHRFSPEQNNIGFDLDLRYWKSRSQEYHTDAGQVSQTNKNSALISGKVYKKIGAGMLKNRDLIFIAGFSLKSSGYSKGYPLAGGLSVNVGIGYSSK